MGEPLNCPCCDGVVETDSQQPYRNFVTGELGNAAAVYCRECGLTVSHCYADLPDMDRDDVMSMAIEGWNIRPADPRIAKLEGLLREAQVSLKAGTRNVTPFPDPKGNA